MKVRLLRDAKIRHKAGEIVEVSPADANFLLSVKSAERVEDKPTRKTTKK
jgi:ribosomal protein L9